MKTAITFSIDTAKLDGYTDQHIAQLWHIAQANPAPITDRDAGELAESIGREIIKRWLQALPPELWAHQGRHYYSCILSDNGSWQGPDHKRWVPDPAKYTEAAP